MDVTNYDRKRLPLSSTGEEKWENGPKAPDSRPDTDAGTAGATTTPVVDLTFGGDNNNANEDNILFSKRARQFETARDQSEFTFSSFCQPTSSFGSAAVLGPFLPLYIEVNKLNESKDAPLPVPSQLSEPVCNDDWYILAEKHMLKLQRFSHLVVSEPAGCFGGSKPDLTCKMLEHIEAQSDCCDFAR